MSSITENGLRPCVFKHPDPETTAGECPSCARFAGDPRWRRLWSRPAASSAASETGRAARFAPLRTICAHRGPELGREMPGCGASAYYSCAVHGECVAVRSRRGRMSCVGPSGPCSDYRAPGDAPSGIVVPIPAAKLPEPWKPPAPAGTEPAPEPLAPKLRWACGVTAVAARRADLLPRTLHSIAAAGFPPPRLFVDGESDAGGWAAEFGLEATARGTGGPLLIHGNWVLALYELYIRDPAADRYAVFQDDVVLCRGVREYLDGCDFPPDGYWNLYTAPCNERPATGWAPASQTKRGQGALGLVFSLGGVLTLLSSAHMADRPRNPIRGWRAVDGGIVDAFAKAGGREWCHTPSLCSHTGTVSTIDKRRHADGRAAEFPLHRWAESAGARTFPGEGFDARGFSAAGAAPGNAG